MRQTLSKATLPSLQLAVWSKPPLFMAQSSRFTKTTPRFPLADLRIPAAQSLSIQSSGPGAGGGCGGRGGGEPTDVWRPELETKLPRSQRAHRSGPGAPNLERRFQVRSPKQHSEQVSRLPRPGGQRSGHSISPRKQTRRGETLEADPTLTG